MAEVFVGPVAQGYASGEVTVLLASPRSFCAGVERAIETVKRVLDVAEGPVYVRKQIVHNTVVVAELRDREQCSSRISTRFPIRRRRGGRGVLRAWGFPGGARGR